MCVCVCVYVCGHVSRHVLQGVLRTGAADNRSKSSGYVDMCADMRVGMCVDMRVDMCMDKSVLGPCTNRNAHQQTYAPMCVCTMRVCVCMRADVNRQKGST